MAANVEIVAILNSGVSFRRLLFPYFIAAGVLASLSFYFNGWVIPHSNKIKLDFENVYIKNPVEFKDRNLHRQISPGVFMYMESYNNKENIDNIIQTDLILYTIHIIKSNEKYMSLNYYAIMYDMCSMLYVN